nr:T9SS type A sorting domain-containing protein [Bacteroidota bacterium]
MINYKFKCLILWTGITILSSSAFAEIILVPQDSPTIQSAINMAQSGDTVLVDTGIYFENVNFNGKNITLTNKFILDLNSDYILNTIIDGSNPTSADTGSCVVFDSGETADAILMGFTIKNGTGTSYDFGGPNGVWREGGGIILSYSSPVIKNNLILQNEAAIVSGANGGGGGGISSMFGNPTIVNNVIIQNQASYAAGLVLNWSGGTIANNIVAFNEVTGNIGTGGIMVWFDGPEPAFVENNTVVGNVSTQDAGGISVTGVAATLRNNIVWGNIQSTGGQIVATPASTVEYNNVQDGYPGPGNISENPLFAGSFFLLSQDSPCVDSGDPDVVYYDKENPASPGNALFPSMGGLTNDMGVYGGQHAVELPLIIMEKIDVDDNFVFENVEIGTTVTQSVVINNTGSEELTIDSITFANYSPSLLIDYSFESLLPFVSDTVSIAFSPVDTVTVYDTVLIYHQFTQVTNPFKIPVYATAYGATSVDQDIHPNKTEPELNIYPNPVSEIAKISFYMDEGGQTTLEIFDLFGRRITILKHGIVKPGLNICEIRREKLICGTYICRLTTASGKVACQRIIFN